MARTSSRSLTWLLIAALIVFAAVYLWLVIDGTGALPGDSGEEAVATADEAASGRPGAMDLGAWPWTAVVLIGTGILGAALAWSQWRAGRLTRSEMEVGERSLRAQHEKDRRDERR